MRRVRSRDPEPGLYSLKEADTGAKIVDAPLDFYFIAPPEQRVDGFVLVQDHGPFGYPSFTPRPLNVFMLDISRVVSTLKEQELPQYVTNLLSVEFQARAIHGLGVGSIMFGE
ncbi:hypothetical protein CYMTET_23762 [Cymbomonas tetramitiformis]|uniref:Uncharacterized protein n=1 Tax=Cymbomonas tetramitiformis TaxID=36881 RepID=A0AAE0L0K7_9CHLO|nr:hypothetical protein CYMTET_23762 [Cymbomonas tetramitiformis]